MLDESLISEKIHNTVGLGQFKTNHAFLRLFMFGSERFLRDNSSFHYIV